jgi:hypothetical protein
MMLWMRWTELYCAAVQELWFGPPEPVRPSATVISLAAERAKRRRPAVRAL